jgi:hypothetical protein
MDSAWISVVIMSPSAWYTARCRASGAMPANAALAMSTLK